MNIRKSVKRNLLVRGVYMLYRKYFSVRKTKFGYISESVKITPPICINEANCYIYDNVSVGPNAFISTPNAKVIIKGNCAIAEHLTIHTGNHARLCGLWVTDINENNKPQGYDKDVIIDKDVWIGCNVTILSGVHVGRGATIAAGAVVCRDVPPYSVVGGIPAKILKMNWTIDEIIAHEKELYTEEQRFTREYLEHLFYDRV